MRARGCLCAVSLILRKRKRAGLICRKGNGWQSYHQRRRALSLSLSLSLSAIHAPELTEDQLRQLSIQCISMDSGRINKYTHIQTEDGFPCPAFRIRGSVSKPFVHVASVAPVRPSPSLHLILFHYVDPLRLFAPPSSNFLCFFHELAHPFLAFAIKVACLPYAPRFPCFPGCLYAN